MASIHIRTNTSTAYITDDGCNYYLDVEMLCVDGTLFLVTKKGALRDTDSIHLFRYSRKNSCRVYNRRQDLDKQFGTIRIYQYRTGWQIPMNCDKPAVNLVMHKLSSDEAVEYHVEKLAAVKDVWYVEGEDGTLLNDMCRNNVKLEGSNRTLVLANKKLGLRVKRGGEWITDYIHFMYRYKIYINDNGEPIVLHDGIGRWAR